MQTVPHSTTDTLPTLRSISLLNNVIYNMWWKRVQVIDEADVVCGDARHVVGYPRRASGACMVRVVCVRTPIESKVSAYIALYQFALVRAGR